MNYSPLDSPERIPTAFVEAWNNRDPDKLASIFDEDAEFVNVVGLWWHDRESIRKAHAYGLERIFNRSTLRLVTVKVKRLSDGSCPDEPVRSDACWWGHEARSPKQYLHVCGSPGAGRLELCRGPQH